ncbi:MAG TPA: protein kinase [Vicinamibacterales bacterium]|nr:protein kinase [Vicinamibacterales bacterium]
MTDRIVSHYRLLEEIGAGGMGVVYRAEDVRLGRTVAIKFLPDDVAADPSAVERFRREARAASALTHPNICIIHAIDDHEGRPFLVMELLEGNTLQARIAGQPLPLDEAVRLAAQIADALHAAHQRGIVHRDIKPANIFLTTAGQVKVLDFGLAKVLGAGAAGAALQVTATIPDGLTRVGSAIGTVAYMSPEQARGTEVDARTDLFSFGLVLYEMLTGRQAFSGITTAVVFDAILNRTPPAPSQVNSRVPADLDGLVARLLEKEPAHRPASAADVREALLRVGSGSRPAAVPARVEQSVAVLYFENLSSATDDQYFRDGITEDIITELTKIKNLRVFPRGVVMAWRDKPVNATDVGREARAAFVLTGSLRRAGSRLRITAQLVETRTGHSIWAERYDREMQDVFEVQDEIARAIAQALRITLSPQEEEDISAKPTENLKAYDYYLKGRGYARRVTRSDLETAMQMFDCSIMFDPGFALAYAGLAQVCGLFYYWHEHRDPWIEKALAAAERALTLDPQLAEGWAARARIAWSQRRYDEAIGFAQRAIALKPNCEGAYWVLAQAYFSTDRYRDVVALTDRAIEANGEDYNTYLPYVLAYERLGQSDISLRVRAQWAAILERQLETVPEDVRARILLSSNYALLGREAEAESQVQRAVGLRPNDSNILYNAACTYGLMRRKAEALDLLLRAKAAGYPNLHWAVRDPDLKILHGLPEFTALVADEDAAPGPRQPGSA